MSVCRVDLPRFTFKRGEEEKKTYECDADVAQTQKNPCSMFAKGLKARGKLRAVVVVGGWEG